MNFRFYHNGTYKEGSHKKDASFYLIDISTDRKGSIYTIADNISNKFKRDKICVKLDTSYAPIDIPADGETIIQSEFEIDSIERFYSVYPLIKQIFAFNTFCENWSLNLDSSIFIANIDILSNKAHISIDENISEKDIKKSFEYVRMTTCVSEILKDNEVLIMKKGKWYIEEAFDDEFDYYPKFDKFDYIGIPLPNTESLYLLTYKEYNLFRKKISVQVNMLYTGDEFSNIDTDDYCANWIDMNNLRDILYGCLFTPQLILLEQKIYDIPMYLEVVISTGMRDLKISISEKEISVPRNTCLFFIIKRLLELEP